MSRTGPRGRYAPREADGENKLARTIRLPKMVLDELDRQAKIAGKHPRVYLTELVIQGLVDGSGITAQELKAKPPEKIMPLVLIAERLGVSKSTVVRWHREPEFPKPVGKLGVGVADTYVLADVRDWVTKNKSARQSPGQAYMSEIHAAAEKLVPTSPLPGQWDDPVSPADKARLREFAKGMAVEILTELGVKKEGSP